MAFVRSSRDTSNPQARHDLPTTLERETEKHIRGPDNPAGEVQLSIEERKELDQRKKAKGDRKEAEGQRCRHVAL